MCGLLLLLFDIVAWIGVGLTDGSARLSFFVGAMVLLLLLLVGIASNRKRRTRSEGVMGILEAIGDIEPGDFASDGGGDAGFFGGDGGDSGGDGGGD